MNNVKFSRIDTRRIILKAMKKLKSEFGVILVIIGVKGSDGLSSHRQLMNIIL